MPSINRHTLKTTAICALGAAVLFFPGGVVMLVIGAALGFWGCSKLNRSDESAKGGDSR